MAGISADEQINLLFKKFTNTVNANPELPFSNTQNSRYPFQNFEFSKNLFIDDIPENLDNITYYDNATKLTYMGSAALDASFGVATDISYEIPNYPLLYYHRIELTNALDGLNNTSWYYPDPNNNKLSLLRGSIPFNYDSQNFTYKQILYDKDNAEIESNSDPLYWLFDYKSGFIQFYGDPDAVNNWVNTNVSPRLSVIVYNGNKGLENFSGYIQENDNISLLNNNLKYIKQNDNISLLYNNLGYIVSNSILSVNNSTNRVGIGTTNPQSKLEVNGELRIQNNGNNGSTITHLNYSGGGNYIRGKFTIFDCPINIVTNNSVGVADIKQYYIGDNNIMTDFFTNKVGFSMSDTTSINATRCFALVLEGTSTNYNVYVFMRNDDTDYLHPIGKFENDNYRTGNINFTGQHRCIANKFLEGNLYYGLIVCAKKNRYINFKNELDITINENLPEVSLSEKENDKSVFGVISSGEDTNNSREYSLGRFTSIFYKTTSNENRMIINSIGEGGIWVSNKNGTLESGDYISSSSIKGYGQKQINNEGILCNYTVAKITCDCEFTLVKKEKKKIKMKDVIVNVKNIIKNPENNHEEEVITEKKLKEFIYDNNGNLQYDNDLDENGNIQYEYEYDTRFLDENANILSGEEEYLSRLNNDENVYIACFVGCTYHCG